MDNSISLLSSFDFPGTERKFVVSKTISDIKSGDLNPLDVAIWMKSMEKVIEGIKNSEDFKEAILAELSKNSGKATIRGVDIEQIEAGTKYDYSSCGHPYVQKINEYKEFIKSAESYLKGIPEDGGAYIDEDTGEVFDVRRPVKISTTTYKVTMR